MTFSRTTMKELDARRMRRDAGLLSAGSMGLYLMIKLLWITSALLLDARPDGWGGGEWIGLNLATVLMAAVGVAAGLAIAQPWGQRLPAPLVVTPIWLGVGFLVSMLPYSAVMGVVGAFSRGSADTSAPSSDMPTWEGALLSFGFIGMALGLLVGVPLYVRERWPGAWSVSVLDFGRPERAMALVVGGVLAALGAARMMWVVGSEWGLKPGIGGLDLEGRALSATFALWCVLASVEAIRAAWTGHCARAGQGVLFIAAGALVAWGSWLLAVRWWDPPGFSAPQTSSVAIATDLSGALTGLVLAALLVRAVSRSRF